MSAGGAFCPYEALGLGPEATDAEVRARFKEMAKLRHPDVDHSPGAAERFDEIKKAYDILTDERERAEYDAYGFVRGEEGSELRRDAVRKIGLVFEQMADVPAEQFETHNPVGALRVALAEALLSTHAALRVRRAEAEERGAVLEVVRRKLRKRGGRGPNLFVGVLERQLRALRGAVADAEEDVRVDEEALRVLDEYEYSAPRPLSLTGSRTAPPPAASSTSGRPRGRTAGRPPSPGN